MLPQATRNARRSRCGSPGPGSPPGTTDLEANDWFSLDIQVRAERLELGEIPERIRAVDGKLELLPGPLGSTHLILQLPLTSPE
jgi:hypothetical protein